MYSKTNGQKQESIFVGQLKKSDANTGIKDNKVTIAYREANTGIENNKLIMGYRKVTHCNVDDWIKIISTLAKAMIQELLSGAILMKHIKMTV